MNLAPQPDPDILAPKLDPGRYVVDLPEGAKSLNLMVEGIHCAGCVRNIEKALADFPLLTEGRVNMSTRRLRLQWQDRDFDPAPALGRVAGLGFNLMPYDPALLSRVDDEEDRKHLRSLAVAGFAAANVMLLSVSVWAGFFSADMGGATRDLFHWVSALIALPAIAYAGRPFFTSAMKALGAGRLNMDVPISLAVILAAAMSLYETITSGAHVYFDAAITLLFFLLIGRYLDRRARASARFAGQHLLALQATAAIVEMQDGNLRALSVEEINPGMRIVVAPGERVPVDGLVASGVSDVDTSLVTGESLPVAAAEGARLFAGTLNLTGRLVLVAEAVGEGTLLAELVRLMEAAEQGRGKHVRIADRVATIYAPVVHILGLATFLGWWLLGGLEWQAALMTGIAVLIVTCPCALGLAVPAVQVVATGRLMRQGIIVKAADALERMASIDTIVFDKTGTLTLGIPALLNADQIPAPDMSLASSIAAASRHPLAKALRAAAPGVTPLEEVTETPGAGLESRIDGKAMRLGSRAWCGVEGEPESSGPELWLSRTGQTPVCFSFRDTSRPGADETLRSLSGSGYALHLISGDRAPVVSALASELGIEDAHAVMLPGQKVEYVQRLAAEGRHVLMVGDGLNDAPALAAARASLSPANAADITQIAADAIFQGAGLGPIEELLHVARRADLLARQNFGIAFAYNAIAVPLAMAGLVTPLIAAVAMSASSLLVITNALRLRRSRRKGGVK